MPTLAGECCVVPNIKKNYICGIVERSPGVTRGRPVGAGDWRRRIAFTLGYVLPDLQLLMFLRCAACARVRLNVCCPYGWCAHARGFFSQALLIQFVFAEDEPSQVLLRVGAGGGGAGVWGRRGAWRGRSPSSASPQTSMMLMDGTEGWN